MAGPYDFAIDANMTFADCSLDFVAGRVLNVVNEEEVESLLLLPWRNDYFLLGTH